MHVLLVGPDFEENLSIRYLISSLRGCLGIMEVWAPRSIEGATAASNSAQKLACTCGAYRSRA
jgi:hypothetical protein